jgi:hypothetical protein
MTPLSYVAVYCGMSWIAGFFLVPTIASECGLDARLRLKNAPAWRVRVACIAAVLLVSPLLPPVIGYCVFQGYREARFWKKFSRRHRELIFERIHPVNLPKTAHSYLANQMPELECLGFVDLGTYLLKPEPLVIYGRTFQSCEGTVVAVLMHMMEENSYTFTTVFENGHVLETSSIVPSPELEHVNQSHRYHAVFAGDLSLADGLERHVDAVAGIERDYTTLRLAFTPRQVQDVMHYENRSFGQWLYESGQLDAPPEPAVCPIGTVVAAHQLEDELVSVQ